MKIINWIKGKIKQREVRNLEPDENFQFKENYYGNTKIIDDFKFLYCNNYTDKLYKEYHPELAFISCVVTIPNNEKSLTDLVEFMNIYYNTQKILYNNEFIYDNAYIDMNHDGINIYLRGDLSFYESICNNIHNNIITRYIRNNIFPNETPIDTPNEFLNNMYNSITNPCKDIDILFIEDKHKFLHSVIGLSISKKCDKIDLDNYHYIEINNRYIVYLEIETLETEVIDYLSTLNGGNKLKDIVHKDILDDIDLDIDELIY